MSKSNTYPGIHNDRYGGMTDIGNIVRDAWVLGVLDEQETCEGWDVGRLDGLYEEVYKAWEPYGHMVSELPPELRARHERIYGAAIERARALGWSPDIDLED